MSNLLCKKKERNLLLKSKVVEDYPEALEFITKNPNAIEENLHEYPYNIQLFFQNLYNKIYKQAMEEWTADNIFDVDIVDKTNKVRCQLCNTHITNICKITNGINENTLIVGSECLKHFGKDLKHSFSKLFEQHRRTKRLEKLVNKFPGIEQIIDTWNLELEVFPVVIIKKLESEYLKLGQEAKILYDNYLNEKNDVRDFNYEEQLSIIFENREKVLKKIHLYVEENKGKEFIATKEIKQWLIKNQKHDILDEIKECGLITWRTSLKIQEPTFIDLVSNKFNDYFKKSNFHIQIDQFMQQGFIIQILDQYKLKILTKYNDFMLDYGGILFGDSIDYPPNKFDLLKSSKMYGENSIETILYLLNKSSKKYGVYIKNMERDIFYEYGDVLIYMENENKYIMPKINSIVEKYKGIALQYDKGSSIMDYVKDMHNSKSKRISQADVNEFRYTRNKLA